jgi:hypothetical protein
LGRLVSSVEDSLLGTHELSTEDVHRGRIHCQAGSAASAVSHISQGSSERSGACYITQEAQCHYAVPRIQGGVGKRQLEDEAAPCPRNTCVRRIHWLACGSPLLTTHNYIYILSAKDSYFFFSVLFLPNHPCYWLPITGLCANITLLDPCFFHQCYVSNELFK